MFRCISLVLFSSSFFISYASSEGTDSKIAERETLERSFEVIRLIRDLGSIDVTDKQISKQLIKIGDLEKKEEKDLKKELSKINESLKAINKKYPKIFSNNNDLNQTNLRSWSFRNSWRSPISPLLQKNEKHQGHQTPSNGPDNIQFSPTSSSFLPQGDDEKHQHYEIHEDSFRSIEEGYEEDEPSNNDKNFGVCIIPETKISKSDICSNIKGSDIGNEPRNLLLKCFECD